MRKKYVCNECDRSMSTDFGPCVLKVEFDADEPSYCPYDCNYMPNWRRVKK